MFARHVALQIELALGLKGASWRGARKGCNANAIVSTMDIKRDFLLVNLGAPLTLPVAITLNREIESTGGFCWGEGKNKTKKNRLKSCPIKVVREGIAFIDLHLHHNY
jgi:hypothetical protein